MDLFEKAGRTLNWRSRWSDGLFYMQDQGQSTEHIKGNLLKWILDDLCYKFDWEIKLQEDLENPEIGKVGNFQ